MEDNEPRKRPQSWMTRNSKPTIIVDKDKDGNWRRRIKMTRHMFDDEAKQVFLEEFSEWGRMGDAAAKAGVSTNSVRRAIKEDEEFAEAMLEAEESYKSKLIGHHQDLLFNGTVKEHYDRNGNIVSREVVYPIRLIELELKKVDPSYREKQEVSVNHSGGVMLAPSETTSIEDWQKRFSNMKDITPKPEALEAFVEEDE